MATPLIEALSTRHGLPFVDAEAVEAFLNKDDGPADRILFFTGDPDRRPAANDVAVILPELLEAFEGRFAAAVVDRAGEEELKKRFGVLMVPSLLFMRDGGCVGVISKIRDWSDYVEKAHAFLDAPAEPLEAWRDRATRVGGERRSGE